MSNRKRGGNRRGAIPRRDLGPAEAAAFEWSIHQAPEIELPEVGSPEGTGAIYHVQRMGILRPDFTGAGPLGVPQGTPWMQTTDGKTYRLPAALQAAVYDLVALTLGAGGASSGAFPARIEFGTIDGRAYVQFAD
jgi:hypothetical protein